MMPALHEDLIPTERDRLFDLLIHLRQRDHIGVGFLLGTIKCAELAIDVADVGVVYVAIDDVGDDFVAAAVVRVRPGELTTAVGEDTEFFQWQLIKVEGVRGGDAIPAPNFLDQVIVSTIKGHGPKIPDCRVITSR